LYTVQVTDIISEHSHLLLNACLMIHQCHNATVEKLVG